MAGSCRAPESPPTVVALEGILERVHPLTSSSSEITVVYSGRQGRDTRRVGVVTADTEILIDGAAAELRHLHEGDRVLGYVRIDRVGSERKLVVLRIQVTRATPNGTESG